MTSNMEQARFDEQPPMDVESFLHENHISELADFEINAHGRTLKVAQGLVDCRPFADMMRGLALGLEQVEDPTVRKSIMEQSIRGMAAGTKSLEVDDTSKKKLKK